MNSPWQRITQVVLVLLGIAALALWTNLSALGIAVTVALWLLLLGGLALRSGQETVVTGPHSIDREQVDDASIHEPVLEPATGHLDIVQECGDESFPASDPPSWTLGRKLDDPGQGVDLQN